jgi:hypothetical protein
MARRLNNWIKAYLAYTNESESPEEYHLWVAISTIAGAIRRRAYFDMQYFILYPNLYIVLVGPAGRCKKSTAMRVGRSLLAEVPDINFTTDSVTRERLIMDLSQSFRDGHSSMTAYSSEFASLLTSSGMDMVVFLTDIFDSPPEWSHRTKTGGTNKIKAPYLNLIGATTPDWIAKAMPMDTVGIGLTSRIIFVYQDTPRVRDPFPILSPEQKQLRSLLLEDLVQMSHVISGEYRLSPAAKEVFSEWYKSRTEQPNTTGDPRLNGYYERKPMHMIRLCMILAASFRDELIITDTDLQEAMKLLEQIEEKMPKVFANVGKNPLTVDYDEVFAAVHKAGPAGADFGQMLQAFKHSVRKDELVEVLETLLAMKLIAVTEKGKYVSIKR